MIAGTFSKFVVVTTNGLVQVSRHGNRASNADYVMDPYPINDTDYWPYGVFGLTPVSGATFIHELIHYNSQNFGQIFRKTSLHYQEAYNIIKEDRV